MYYKLNDDEFKRLKNKLLSLREKYKNYVNISFIFDKNMITGYKDAPIDQGPDIFLKLFLYSQASVTNTSFPL